MLRLVPRLVSSKMKTLHETGCEVYRTRCETPEQKKDERFVVSFSLTPRQIMALQITLARNASVSPTMNDISDLFHTAIAREKIPVR